MVNTLNRKLTEASKANPCPHCGKPDWCYSLDNLTVCKRDAEPATGWYKTTKQDSEGAYYYAPISEKKPVRREGTRFWEYRSRQGKKLVQVCRQDDGKGHKKIWQEHWEKNNWVAGVGKIKREDIPVYEYERVQKGINQGQMIFICEGEPCADALISLGFIATTNIGGAGKWTESDTKDLTNAIVCLVPDRDKPGMRHMEQIAQSFPDAQWLYPYPTSLAWQNLPESSGLDVADWIADFNLKANDILDAITEKKRIVTGDSSKSGDSSKPDPVSFTQTVTTVTAILREAYPDWQEQQLLDELEAKTEMSKKAFWSLVASVRCNLEEVQPEDNKLFEQLINWHDAKLDVEAILPHLGADIIHDAKVLNIDPVAILHPLLPAVLSLLSNQVVLDVESHQEPPVLYTCLVGESGTGKSRGQKLVFAPLENLQVREKKRFDEEFEEYKKALEAKENKDKPIPQRKYLFKVSTIQAVIKRLADQGHGSVWSRDEIAGLFKSLDQFTNGAGEALEILLELWNSGVVQVDRVSEEDSFIVRDTCLSIYGGIQPGKFSSIFKDPDDANGLQARFLFAVISPQPAKRVKGYCRLANKLPQLYDWINLFGSTKIKLSEQADKRYTSVYEQIGNQAESSSLPAIRGWLRKLPAQILRIAIALHAIDCYFEQNRPKREIQIDTLNRAIDLCRYYRNSFALVQEKASDSDNLASILWKIWDEAVKRPEGLLCRDAYRIVKAIQRRAREMGRTVSAYTFDLFKQLEKQGWGCVQRGENKRTIRFVAIAKPDEPPTEPPTPPTEPPQPPTEPPTPPTEPPTATENPPTAKASLHNELSEKAQKVLSEYAGKFCTFKSEEMGTELNLAPVYKSVGVTEFKGEVLLQVQAPSQAIISRTIDGIKNLYEYPQKETLPQDDDVATAIEWINMVIADNSSETASDIAEVLTDMCNEKSELRSQIWEALSTEQRSAFKELLKINDSVQKPLPPVTEAIAKSEDPEIETIANEMLARDMEKALAKGLKIGDRVKYDLNNPDWGKTLPHLCRQGEIISEFYAGKHEPLAVCKVKFDNGIEEEVQVRFLEKVDTETTTQLVEPLQPENLTVSQKPIIIQDLPIGAIVLHKESGHCAKIFKKGSGLQVQNLSGGEPFYWDYLKVEPLEEFAKSLKKGMKLKAKKHADHPFAATSSSKKFGTIEEISLSKLIAVVATDKHGFVEFNLEAVEIIQ